MSDSLQTHTKPSSFVEPHKRLSSITPGNVSSTSDAPRELLNDQVSITRFIKKLDSGACGEVFEAMTAGGDLVAVKIFDLGEDFQKELKIMSYLKNSISSDLAGHIPKLYGAVHLTASNIDQLARLQKMKAESLRDRALALELLKGPTLYDADMTRIDIDDLERVVIGIVKSLHQSGVTHGDVSYDNIILDGWTEDGGYKDCRAVLFDWGESKVWTPEERLYRKISWKEEKKWDFRKIRRMFRILRGGSRSDSSEC